MHEVVPPSPQCLYRGRDQRASLRPVDGHAGHFREGVPVRGDLSGLGQCEVARDQLDIDLAGVEDPEPFHGHAGTPGQGGDHAQADTGQ